jgi:hypothetical protein
MSATTDPDLGEKVSATYSAIVKLSDGSTDSITLYQVGQSLIPSQPPWMSLMEWLRSGQVSYIDIQGV